jgi:hypothetical protein
MGCDLSLESVLRIRIFYIRIGIRIQHFDNIRIRIRIQKSQYQKNTKCTKGCQQAVSNRLGTQKSHHCNPHFMTIPMIGHNPYFRLTVNILYFLILQTFAHLGCRQAVRNRLDTQKSHHCDPHLMPIPMIGHNPYFRLTVNILYFSDFANICTLRLSTGCQQQVRHTKVTS